MSLVTLDYTNMMSPILGGPGLDPERLEGGMAESFRLRSPKSATLAASVTLPRMPNGDATYGPRF